ncbi:MAG: hypothetical protein K0S47_2163 [Herbinix sp.]|jgi:hypothetical protein|nr:hypothetical protein [Herbinix sp.]
MKYEAINELSNFEYHDSIIEKIYFKNNQMIWEVRNINATTENSQNNFDNHMCVVKAVMIFENAQIESVVFGGYQMYDCNNVLLESKEEVIASPEEYDDIFKSIDGVSIYSLNSFSVLDDGRYKVCFNTKCDITVIFSKSIIKWDDYSGMAWYESVEFKKYREEHSLSWVKFLEENKIGNVIDIKVKEVYYPRMVYVEILPSLCSQITLKVGDVFIKGEIHKAEITYINEETHQILLAICEKS